MMSLSGYIRGELADIFATVLVPDGHYLRYGDYMSLSEARAKLATLQTNSRYQNLHIIYIDGIGDHIYLDSRPITIIYQPANIKNIAASKKLHFIYKCNQLLACYKFSPTK